MDEDIEVNVSELSSSEITIGVNRYEFLRLIVALIFAAALWLNIATWSGAPVSTTHSSDLPCIEL